MKYLTVRNSSHFHAIKKRLDELGFIGEEKPCNYIVISKDPRRMYCVSKLDAYAISNGMKEITLDELYDERQGNIKLEDSNCELHDVIADIMINDKWAGRIRKDRLFLVGRETNAVVGDGYWIDEEGNRVGGPLYWQAKKDKR